MNNFDRQNAWQHGMRDKILAPHFYGRYACDGRYVFIDKGRLKQILRRCAVDTVVQGRAGTAICIEEKIVRWPGYDYTCFALETMSCTVPGHESSGWMDYGQADYLLYCFANGDENGLSCWLIDFPQLKDWFWNNETSFKPFGPVEPPNWTIGRKVPIATVVQNIQTYHRMLPEAS